MVTCLQKFLSYFLMGFCISFLINWSLFLFASARFLLHFDCIFFLSKSLWQSLFYVIFFWVFRLFPKLLVPLLPFKDHLLPEHKNAKLLIYFLLIVIFDIYLLF